MPKRVGDDPAVSANGVAVGAERIPVSATIQGQAQIGRRVPAVVQTRERPKAPKAEIRRALTWFRVYKLRGATGSRRHSELVTAGRLDDRCELGPLAQALECQVVLEPIDVVESELRDMNQ